jgi:hypothetical protein
VARPSWPISQSNVVGSKVPLASVASGKLVSTPLTPEGPHPLAMCDTKDEGGCTAPPGVEAAATLQQRQESSGDEVVNIMRVAAAPCRVATHQMAVAPENELQRLRVGSYPSQQLGIGRFVDHNMYW